MPVRRWRQMVVGPPIRVRWAQKLRAARTVRARINFIKWGL